MKAGMIAGRLFGVVAASALCVQTPVSAGQDSRSRPMAVVDGTPSAQACAPYGFGQAYGEDEAAANAYPPTAGYRGKRPRNQLVVTGGRVAAPNVAMAPPPPAPPPPPPPSPMMEPAPPPPAKMLPPVTAAVPPALARGIIGPPGPPAGTIETERYPSARTNSVKRVAEEPVSTFSIDVDTASYTNVRRFLREGSLPPRDAVRVEEMVNYFDYNYPRPASAEQPFRALTSVAPSPWSRGKEIIHIGLQGYDLPRAERPPLNLVFLVDVSGSMYSEDRLPLAISSLNVLVDQLRPRDRVSLVVYAGAAGAVLDPTPGYEKLKIRCGLGALKAGGSTAGGQGLALAYAMAERNLRRDAVNRVILMTDGDFNVGVADPSKLTDFVAEKRKTGVYLSVYGFGRGNYNDVMMQALAQNGNGTAAYIDEIEEARKLFRTDFTQSLFPIADDVKIQVEFNPARVSEYRLIGYETRLLNREDFNNDRVDAGEVGAGASVTALYEITPAGGASSVDPLRYGPAQPAPAQRGGELAFLRIRYKPPGGATSRLIEQPIGAAQTAASLERAPESTRFALAVAGFAQRLRGDPWLGDGFGSQDVARLARGAMGYDPDHTRAEFVDLVRASEGARSVNE